MAAYSAVSAIAQQRSSAIIGEMTRFAGSEAALALRAAGELVLCSTPAEIVAAQSHFVLGWFARTLSQSVALGALGDERGRCDAGAGPPRRDRQRKATAPLSPK